MFRKYFSVVAAVAVISVGVVAVAGSSMPVHASDPCGPIQYDPNPPIGEPERIISGTVRDISSGGISGATVMLYQCSSGSGVYQTSTTTSSSGTYSFGSLGGGYWYYVVVPLTGPLTNMTPASGTSNPTAAIGIGNSVSGVNLSFQ